MQNKFDSFFTKYEFLLPFIIFVLFLCASLPGISWGAPDLWNPDEMVWRVGKALDGDLIFDETEPDWNYPSLPKYVMYAIGTIVYGFGKSGFAFIVSARIFSAVLGAISGVLVYYLAKNINLNKSTSFLAGIFYVVSSIAAENGRFAHNDLYLQFFVILSVYFAVKYWQTNGLYWGYLSFFMVGLAASSKYTGGSLILLPIFSVIALHWSQVFTRWYSVIGKLVMGGIIAYLGYGLGTPKSLTDPIHYFSSVLPALKNLTDYGFNFETQIGLYGQWAEFENAVGVFLYYLFLISFVWYVAKLLMWKLGRTQFDAKQRFGTIVFSITILIFDLPFLISINYIERYFIPFVPFLSIFAALFVYEILNWLEKRNNKVTWYLTISVLVFGIFYSSLRLVSISLLFINDARFPASEYITTLRGYQKSIEYTLYPPAIEKRRFERAHNYPIYFVEWADDEVPTGGRYEYNQGEQGLLDRNTDYFVIDSLTYGRFSVYSICATTPVECDFFKRLIDEEIASFKLIKKFTYELPSFLPQLSVYSVNPDVLIFERVR